VKKSVCQAITFPKHLAQLKNWLFKLILAVLSKPGKKLSTIERASTLKTSKLVVRIIIGQLLNRKPYSLTIMESF